MTEPHVIQVSTDASYAELREAEDRIKEQLAKVASQARQEALDTIVSSIKEFGFTAEELNAAITGKRKPGRKPGIKGAVAPVTSKKAAPKYRNPADHSQTWTGRGVAPGWIKDVAKDARDAYLIPQEAAPTPAPVAQEPEAEAAPATETASVFETA